MDALVAAPVRPRRGPGALLAAWRPSVITAGGPTFPLLVLLGLNTVDELDRSAFAVLLPDIRDHFGLSDAAALSIVATTTIAALLVEVPLALYADRNGRARLAVVGAAIWTLLSVATGVAFTLPLLLVARIGAAMGRSVVNPTHSALLTDYYAPEARLQVFAAHRQASSLGQVVAPLLAGGIAHAFGWRAPFLVFAVPSLVLVILAGRLREPVAADRGAPPALGLRAALRALAAVPQLRRLWTAAPFLAIALFGVPTLLALVYEDVFGLSTIERGTIATAIEPLQMVGVLVGIPLLSRVAVSTSRPMLDLVAAIVAVDGLLLVALAFAPHVAIAIALHALLASSIGLLAPVVMMFVSLVAPPQARSLAFSSLSLFALPGIAVFLPLIGVLSDGVGVQLSMLVLVPLAIAGSLLVARAGRTA